MGENKKPTSIKPVHVVLAACIVGVVIVGVAVTNSIRGMRTSADKEVDSLEAVSEETLETAYSEEESSSSANGASAQNMSVPVYPTEGSDVKQLDDSLIQAKSAVLVNMSDNTIMAERDPDSKIYPASMTKVMTLIVAAEHLTNLNDEYTFTDDLIQPLIDADAAMAGFQAGEKVTVKDLFYGCGLPSGADATEALASLVAGSDDAFVQLMNEKAAALGLKNTHFTNCTGLQDENHYTTATDMAVIMEYAMQNETVKKVLSTYEYTTDATNIHHNGVYMESTTFSKMYGTECEGITIEAGKTGFTDEAGYCLVSYATDGSGNNYVCVAANSSFEKGAVFDTLNIYGTISGGYNKPTTTPTTTGTGTSTTSLTTTTVAAENANADENQVADQQNNNENNNADNADNAANDNAADDNQADNGDNADNADAEN